MKLILALIFILGVAIFKVKCQKLRFSPKSNEIVREFENGPVESEREPEGSKNWDERSRNEVLDLVDEHEHGVPGEEDDNEPVFSPYFLWWPDDRTTHRPGRTTQRTTKRTTTTRRTASTKRTPSTKTTPRPPTCGKFIKCGQCVSHSQTKCNFCVREHLCVPSTQCERSWNSVLVYYKDSDQPLRGPEGCPRILSFAPNHKHEISVAWSSKHKFVIKADVKPEHFPPEVIYRCRFVVDLDYREYYMTDAKLVGDQFHCDEVQIAVKAIHYNRGDFLQKDIDVDVIFAIPGRDWRKLDNPNKLKLYAVICNFGANDCDKCVSLNKKFKCAWCLKESRCLFQDGRCPRSDEVEDKESCQAQPTKCS